VFAFVALREHDVVFFNGVFDVCALKAELFLITITIIQ